MTQPDGLSYHDTFLTLEEQRILHTQIALLNFVHDTFRCKRLKRSYAQFGYAYGSAGRTVMPAAPFPDFLIALKEKITPYTSEFAAFNQGIITRYPKAAGIGWHTDAKRFGDCIIGISLGGAARLQFRPNATTSPSHELIAAPGSLYIMRGPARWEYQHRVLPVKTDRYSITLRNVPD